MPIQDITSEPLASAINHLIKSKIQAYFKNIKGSDYNTTSLHEIVLTEVESGLIESVLQINHYKIDKTAKVLGITVQELREKLDKYGF
jgi:DNA-binding protein Fis